MSVQVGQKAPDFKVEAVVGKEFKEIKLSDYRGKWVVLFFYPLDFTFVCPTEIKGFSQDYHQFQKAGAVVLGGSVDSKFSHLAWINQDLGTLNYLPLIRRHNQRGEPHLRRPARRSGRSSARIVHHQSGGDYPVSIGA